MPLTRVKGDSLSPILFNLAAELIIRAAKQFNGTNLFDSKKVITTYADDSVIITTCQTEMDQILESIFSIASSLGLQFNGSKSSSLSLIKCEHAESFFPCAAKSSLS